MKKGATKPQKDQRISDVPDWSQIGDAIQRTFAFKNFVESMSFVNKVAVMAEQHHHHPDILVRYNKVTLTLTTHDAGGLTEKDFAAAQEIDGLARRG